MTSEAQNGAHGISRDDLIAVARAVRTRGLQGEIVADLLTDFPDRFESLVKLFAITPQGDVREVELENHWFQSGRVVLKIAGFDSIESAQSLVGWEFAVPESERVQLEADEYYEYELIGCQVETILKTPVGTVSKLIRTGGADVLVVENQNGHEHLIPLAEAICVEIDVAEKLIRIDPPEGLLEF
jgi:16S rRNA processing protein RimM